MVSIPQGTIKRQNSIYNICKIYVSIPQGTIKRQLDSLAKQSTKRFQFHKVRLKDERNGT